MKKIDMLKNQLLRIDGRGYKAYKDIQGVYDYGNGVIIDISYVQGDPFASPSKACIRVDQKIADFPQYLYQNKYRKIALEDFLSREFYKNINKIAKGNRGTGKSGLIAINRCGQEVLERTSIIVNSRYIEARIALGLPARGRRVLAQQAIEMFFKEIPEITMLSLLYKNIDGHKAKKWVELYEDQEFIRNKLKEMKLVAFVANDSILPRESGISDKPMRGNKVIPFKSPPSLEIEIHTPNRGVIRGMGIPSGITLIVGGGYHGKSTLLRAIERGVYNHIMGDGREFVITCYDSVKIRAEDGRRIEKVNISPFINNLPFKKDTSCFSTDEASGSTSQAANIMEALEMGAKVLLLDEDTSASNFMIRDVRMQQLVSKEKEPITPFIDKVKLMKRDLGVSTIMVVGGSGDYFDVADLVIMMDEYKPKDVTQKAKEISERFKGQRKPEGGENFGNIGDRIPLPESINPKKGKKIKINAKDIDDIRFGWEDIDLTYVEQLVDISQTRAIGDIINYAREHYMDGETALKEIIERIVNDISQKGLDVISPFYEQHPGEYALPRKYEIAAAINRLRTLKVK